MKQLLSLVAAIVLCMPACLVAKGPTTRVTVTSVRDGRVATLSDPLVLAQFTVWDGPGTFSGPTGQQIESTEGFIVDWPAGPVIARPGGLERFEVDFFVRHRGVGPEELAYVVLYERDVKSGDGFVYLPGKADRQFPRNVQSISRGARYEGQWFRATREWQQVVGKSLQ
jgi:hypothetical protein